MVARRLEELDDPDALLFPSLGSEGVVGRCPETGDRIVGAFTEGKTWRRHVDLAIADVDGWPEGETWHALRDVYAVTLIDDLEMKPGDAILNTGHENASTFWDRYYGTRAAGVEKRTAEQAEAAIERWRAAR